MMEEMNYPLKVAIIFSIRQINVRYKTAGTGIEVISIKYFITICERKIPLRRPRHIYSRKVVEICKMIGT
jgi:hypothetical protein